MGCVNTCDICGRTLLELPGYADIDRYKLKKLTYLWYERSWDRVDICTECLDEIRKKVRKGGTDEK